MQNPYYKVTIGSQNYDFTSDSWKMTNNILSSYTNSQSGGDFQSTGLQKTTHTLQIYLQTGSTTSGLSNTADTLLDTLRYTLGSSRFSNGQTPYVLFVAPNGATSYVGAVGTLNIEPILNRPQTNIGYEYRVNLTLQEI